MKHKSIQNAILLIIVLQTMVLGGEYLNAIYPLWTGQEIKLNTVPVDPRSMFRGNYARLRYEISDVDGEEINKGLPPRNGEIIYLKLQADKNGIFTPDVAVRQKPKDGVFIRGRIAKNGRFTRERYQVKYGIEAFFAPKEKALQLEKDMSKGGVALIMLADNGKATLKNIILKERKD